MGWLKKNTGIDVEGLVPPAISNIAVAAAVIYTGGAAGAALGAGATSTLSIALAGTAISGATIVTAGYAIGNLAAAYLISEGVKSITGGDRSPSVGQALATGILLNTTSNVAGIPIIYGTRKVGGSRVFTEVSGGSNEFLHLVIVLGEGEVSAVTQTYIDNVAITDPKFAGLVTQTVYFGTDAQTADTGLVADLPTKWTANHRGQGVAYVVLKLKYAQAAYSGFPTVTFDLQGKKVYDPRQNLLVYSELFDQAAWSKNNASVSVNAAIAPNGSLTADKIVENTVGGVTHYLGGAYSGTVTSGSPLTLSVYVKSGERNEWMIRFFAGGAFTATAYCTFNSTTGLITSNLGGTGLVEALANGWYRINFTASATATGAVTVGIMMMVAGNNSWLGDGVSGAFVWGAQLTAGSTALPYTATSATILVPVTAFSSNPALCVRDYLTNTRYGRGIPAASIDEASIVSAANYCDEMVSTPAGTQKRYSCDGVVDVNSNAYENIKSLLTSCRGLLVYSGGIYKLVLDRPTASTFAFTEDNITGNWSISQPGRRSKYNRVTAGFFNPTLDWNPDLAISDSPAYRTLDNNLLLEGKIDLPFCSDVYRAQRMAGIHLKQSRFGVTCMFTAFQSALRCEVGDVVTITHSTPGWSGKLFKVMQITIKDNDEVEIVAAEYDSTVYNLDTLTLVTSAATLTLPSVFTVPTPAGLTLSSGTSELLLNGDGTVTSRLKVVWSPPANIFADKIEIQYQINGVTTWQTFTTTSSAEGVSWIWPVKDSTLYNVRVRYINTAGVQSPWISASHTVVGKTAPPSNVASPTYAPETLGIRLSWTAITDADRAGYELRTGGSSWETANFLTLTEDRTYLWRMQLAGTQTVWIKAKDTTGNYSTTAGSTSVVVSAPSAPTVTYAINGPDDLLTWTIPTSAFPVDRYEIRYGVSYAAGTFVDTSKSTGYRRRVDYAGARTYWVAAIDIAGNTGTAAAASPAANIVVPTTPTPLNGVLNNKKITLSWPVATGTLPILRYEVRYGSTFAAGTLVAQVLGTTIDVVIDYLGPRTYWVAALDTANNQSGTASFSVNLAVPVAPTVTPTWASGSARVNWSTPASSLPIDFYEVTQGPSRTAVGTVNSNQLIDPSAWGLGVTSRTYYVRARDVNGNLGAEGASSLVITAPAAPVISSTLSTVDPSYKLTWSAPASDLPIDYYEVFMAGVSQGRVYATTYSAKVVWSGTRAFTVIATDIFGTLGATGSTSLTITAPTAPTLSAQVVDNNVLLSWTTPTATLPVDTYEIRRGASWATATVIGQKSGGFTSVFETVAGTFNYWVAAIDTAGNYGTPASVSAFVNQPPDYVLRSNITSGLGEGINLLTYSQDFGNANWTDYWLKPTNAGGFLAPDGSMTAWKFNSLDAGPSLNSSGIVGLVTGPIPGPLTRSIWLRCETGTLVMGFGQDDTDTNPITVTTTWQRFSFTNTPGITTVGSARGMQINEGTVSNTAWYAWGAQLERGFTATRYSPTGATITGPISATLSNASRDSGVLTLPVNTTETFATHFTSRLWNTPNDQITASPVPFPVYIQPSLSPGYYEETIDYGTSIPASKVTIAYLLTTIAGSVSAVCDISVSLDNVSYTSYAGQSQAYATNFRYVKFRITVTAASGTGVGTLSGVTIKLDSKLKTITGMAACLAADSGGSTVYLTDNKLLTGTKVFLDVDAIQVDPLYNATYPGLTAIYDFADTTNPLSFKILVFDNAGVRRDGTVSYTVRGF
jgi:hypothetical protein